MKQIIGIIFSAVILLGCKNNTRYETKPASEASITKSDSVRIPPIKVFSVVYDSINIKPNSSEELTLLNEKLNGSYREDRSIENEEYLNNLLGLYKTRSFAGVLARDFNNDDFKKAVKLNVSFISKEREDTSGEIRIEEWHFKDEKTALSCFKSLLNYKEREIHFKVISWIWLQQDNKLFLIFTTRFQVDAEPMQFVKQHLIDILKKQGEYNLIEMD